MSISAAGASLARTAFLAGVNDTCHAVTVFVASVEPCVHLCLLESLSREFLPDEIATFVAFPPKVEDVRSFHVIGKLEPLAPGRFAERSICFLCSGSDM